MIQVEGSDAGTGGAPAAARRPETNGKYMQDILIVRRQLSLSYGSVPLAPSILQTHRLRPTVGSVRSNHVQLRFAIVERKQQEKVASACYGTRKT